MTHEPPALLALFRESQVARGDFRALAAPLLALAAAGGENLAALMGRVDVAFEDRCQPGAGPVYVAPAVRAFARGLLAGFPHWFFFLSLAGSGLQTLTFAVLDGLLVRTEAGRCTADYPTDHLVALFRDQCADMEALFGRAGLGRKAFERRVAELSAYYGLRPEDWAD